MPVFPLVRAATGAALSLLATAAAAGIISPVYPGTVGTGVNCEFGSIQSALDAAAAAPGPQTILVTRSIAHANLALVVDDAGDVTLQGGYETCHSPRDAGNTALDGTGAQAVLRVVGAGNVTLRQLDISGGGGSVPPGGSGRAGGGVLQLGSGTLALEQVELHDNAGAGAAAVVGSGTLSILESAIRDNTGSGIHADTSGSLQVRFTPIHDNGSVGIAVTQADTMDVAGVTMAGHGYVNLDLAGTGQLQVADSALVATPRGIAYAGSGRLDVVDVDIVGTGAAVGCSGLGGMTIAGAGNVLLERVTLLEHCAQSGGGLAITGTGTTRLRATTIAGNRAASGGGISVEGVSASERPHVRFEADVIVEDNHADVGGGIHLHQADLDATQAPGHAIRNNTATYTGGGLHLRDAAVRIGSGQPGGSIAGNRSEQGGGGFYLSGRADVLLYTTDPDVPAGIVGNSTAGNALGGGLSAYPEAGATRVFAFDARIVDNIAPVGGGVSMVAFGAGSGAVFCLGTARRPGGGCDDFDGGALPPDARACRDATQCNLVRGNRGEGIFGGAALFRGAGNGAGAMPMRVVAARLVGNVGRSLINSMPADPGSGAPSGTIEILDSVLAGNTATNALLDGAPPGVANFPPDAAFAMGPVVIERSTIAGNAIGASHVLGKRLGLRIDESIVHQPFLTVHAGNAAGIEARSIIVENATGLPARADIVIADPLLTDAANGDVRLLPGSPAIDFSNLGSGGFDVDGIARGQDAPGAPTRFGLRDLGAHELGVATLFRDGFEGDAPIE